MRRGPDHRSVDGSLVVSGDNLNGVVKEILNQMCAADCELITLYYGNNVQQDDARALVGELNDGYPDLEFELVFGGQPHYHYILSAE